MQEEVFLPINNLPGYFISSLGRVRKGLSMFLSTPKTPKGYHVIQVMQNGKRTRHLLHRVVAAHFIGDITGLEVDHLDFNKSNNCVQNLEIVTRTENMQRYHKYSPNKNAAYDKISQTKLINNQAKRRKI